MNSTQIVFFTLTASWYTSELHQLKFKIAVFPRNQDSELGQYEINLLLSITSLGNKVFDFIVR